MSKRDKKIKKILVESKKYNNSYSNLYNVSNNNCESSNSEESLINNRYYSNNIEFFYYSKTLNQAKTYSSYIGRYKFYCSYNSFMNKREYNEDKILINSPNEKVDSYNNQLKIKNNINLFCIFDGHSGKKCSSFLMENFDKILLENKNIITDTAKVIKNTFLKADKLFGEKYKPKNLLIPLEKSGSCALCILTIDNNIYSANAGDSRAIYSENSSKEIYQISYEHKPKNEIKRIKKAGGEIYSNFNNTIWRIKPGNLAVSFNSLNNIYIIIWNRDIKYLLGENNKKYISFPSIIYNIGFKVNWGFKH